MDSAQISEILTRHLELTLSPVAVSLFGNTDNPEWEVFRPEKPIRSYCHGVISAANGKSLYLWKTDILCHSGAATLGFSGYSENMISGDKHYNAGVYGSTEAAKKAVLGARKLQDGSTKALLLRPLAEVKDDYQVLLLTANAEQVMFIAVADKYESGGRTEISMATGFQGICGDATAYVLETGNTNFSVTGFGDRLRCGLSSDLIIVGMPQERVPVIATNLEAMGYTLLAKYKKARDSEKGDR